VLGGVFVLLAGLGYAAGGIEFKRRMAGVDPAAAAAATMGASALLTLPAAVVTFPAGADADSLAAVLGLGVVGTGAAFLIFYGLIADIGPSKASLVAYLTPGFAVGYGVAALGESVTAGTFAGLALILGGSYLAAGGRLPARRAAAYS
jgi:drug/metabolite transporter (DMT)-like permease